MPLRQILKGKVVILGIGNPLRGDDGLGPALAAGLQGLEGVVCFDAGTAPESYAGKIIQEKPDTVLLVDAVDLQGPPGAYALLKEEEILKSGLTTHDLSPRLFISYLRENISADIYLLGVQPQTLEMGEDMSPQVQKTLQEVQQLIKEACHA